MESYYNVSTPSNSNKIARMSAVVLGLLIGGHKDLENVLQSSSSKPIDVISADHQGARNSQIGKELSKKLHCEFSYSNGNDGDGHTRYIIPMHHPNGRNLPFPSTLIEEVRICLSLSDLLRGNKICIEGLRDQQSLPSSLHVQFSEEGLRISPDTGSNLNEDERKRFQRIFLEEPENLSQLIWQYGETNEFFLRWMITFFGPDKVLPGEMSRQEFTTHCCEYFHSIISQQSIADLGFEDENVRKQILSSYPWKNFLSNKIHNLDNITNQQILSLLSTLNDPDIIVSLLEEVLRYGNSDHPLHKKRIEWLLHNSNDQIVLYGASHKLKPKGDTFTLTGISQNAITQDKARHKRPVEVSINK